MDLQLKLSFLFLFSVCIISALLGKTHGFLEQKRDEYKKNQKDEKSISHEVIKGWNWGAFLLPPFWGLWHKQFLAILGLIPFLGILIGVMLGLNGNKLAWENRNWINYEYSKIVQRLWAIWGIFLNIYVLLIFVFIYKIMYLVKQ